MGLKLKKIDRVTTSLKELIDIDSSTGIPRCVDCIANGMVLIASVSKNASVKDTFVFKNLSDIIQAGSGVQTSLSNGILTISAGLESINLNDLLDVSITTPAADDVLTYNSILQRWENTASSWVPTSRTITINGVIQDLSADRTWTISGVGSGTVTSVTGTGTVSGLTLSGTVTTTGNLTLGGTLTLTSGQISSALGYNPLSQITANGLYYPLSSNPSSFVTSSSLSSTLGGYLTISAASSTYQPIFITDNGLTYSGGYLKLGGQLTGNTIVDGASGAYKLELKRFSELMLEASDGTNATEINLTTTKILFKTPSYSSSSIGDVLTLTDPTTGEVEFQTPTGGSGGLAYATASGTNTYTATISGVTTYIAGDAYIINFTNGSDDDSTININGLGAKLLVKEFDVQVTGGDILAGQELIIIYDGTNFQCIGVAPNQLFAYVTNDDSVTINKGQPVYAFGAAGNRMSVKLASNTADATSAQTVGVVFSSSIAAGQKGFIITQGVISGVNTAAYSAGTTLYLGATAGTLTSTKPYAPNHLVYIGTVEKSNAGSGQIYIKPQNGYELDEIHDVDLISTAPVNNDVLTYVTGSPNLWKPKSLTTILGYTPLSAAITSLNGLTAATQTFATPGTTGTAPNWSSATSTHTLNIPLASAAGVTAGLISKTDYDTFASKPSTDTMIFASAPNSSHTNINGTTSYWTITGSGAIRATENAAIVVMPYAGTLKNFYVRVGAGASSSGSIVLTVRKNGADTTITVTFTSASGSNFTISDTTNTVSVAAGDRITIGGTNNATAQAGTIVSTVLTLERS